MATISNNEIKIKYSLDTTDLANATALFDRLSAEDRQLLNDLKRLQAQLNATGQAGQTAMNNVGRSTRIANDEVSGLGKSILAINSYVAGAFAVGSIISFGKAVLDATIKMEGLRKAIEFTSGSLVGGQANFEFIKKVAEDFGIPLEAAAEGFKSLSAAAARNKIPMATQRQMFLDLSKAMSALQLDSQSAGLVLFGFGQLLSKPKVSAQELYHQIGERLPIALEAAKIALQNLRPDLQVTDGLLIKMVESGEIFSGTFAPEFTKALGKLSESGAYVESLGKDVNRLGNEWKAFLEELGKSGILTFIISSLKSWTETLNMATQAISLLVNNLEVFNPLSKKTIASLYEELNAQKLVVKGYDDIIEWAAKRNQKLVELNAEYQYSLVDESQKALQKRKLIEEQYNAEREAVLNDIANGIKKRENEILKFKEQIAVKQKEIDDQYLRTGTTKELESNIKFLETKIKGNLAQIEALKQSIKTVPILGKALLDPETEKKKQKELENLYKKLIDQQEALMKAEEDLIKSRTKAGTNQDILILENRIKFNNKMLAIDQDARFKELELAKNNAVKRRAEITKDEELTQETIRQVRFKAFAAEKEYLDKNLEVIQDAQRKRRQAMQTDEQNELETTMDFYEDKLKVLTDSYKKNIKEEGLQKKDLERLERDYYRAKYELTEDGEKAALDIKAKYRAKEKADTQKTDLEIRSTMVEAASIRNQALTRVESEKADIAEEAAISQIKIEKEKNEVLRLQNEENSTLSIQEKENLNKQLEAQDVLLDAKLTEIVKQGELRRLQEREEKNQKVMEIAQTLADGLFDIYNQQLNNELTALNNRYNEEVRLADGNKQKLAELEQQKNQKEKELKIKQFRADQMAATARVIFATATQLMSSALNPAMIPYIIGLSVAQLAAIAAQPVPEFAEGTKGIPFKGGPAIVGEKGIERVVTESGKVYYTPPTATLVDLPRGAQVIPNHALSKKELFMATALSQGKSIGTDMAIVPKLDEIGGILKSLPVHQVNMNEKGFEKFIRTPRRTTKILNSQFPNKF